MAALLAVLSSALWGAADFGGGMVAKRLPPIAVVGWSQSAALAAIAVTAALTTGFGGSRGWVGWALLAGLSGAGGLVAFYSALAGGTMGVVSPIAALGAVVPVVAGLLSGDSPNAAQVAGITLGLTGAVAASGPELRGTGGGTSEAPGSARSRSVVLAGVAGLLFGVALLGIQRGAQTDPLLTLVGMRVASVTVFVLVAVAVGSRGGISVSDLPVLAAIGVADVGANLLFALASTRGMPSVVAVLGALYPVVTVLLGAVILGERLRPVQRAGVVLALGGVALLASA